MIGFYKRKITDAYKDIALDKLTVFNLLPYPRNRVVRSEVIHRIKFKIIIVRSYETSYQVINKEIIDAELSDHQIVHYGIIIHL